MRYVLAFIIILMPGCAQAAVIAVGEGDGVKVSLTDEPCALPAVVNLPRRATWEEKGKTFQGCWGRSGPVVMAYFDDRTAAVFPVQMFVPVKTL